MVIVLVTINVLEVLRAEVIQPIQLSPSGYPEALSKTYIDRRAAFRQLGVPIENRRNDKSLRRRYSSVEKSIADYVVGEYHAVPRQEMSASLSSSAFSRKRLYCRTSSKSVAN